MLKQQAKAILVNQGAQLGAGMIALLGALIDRVLVDTDRDGIPDVVDKDRDGDGVPNKRDAAPLDPSKS